MPDPAEHDTSFPPERMIYVAREGESRSSTPGGQRWPDAPAWRRFDDSATGPLRSRSTAGGYRLDLDTIMEFLDESELDLINAALFLRRPLLLAGHFRDVKTGLISHLAEELGLGSVLRWGVQIGTTLRAGLYEYDELGRATAVSRWAPDSAEGPANLGDFIRLGPLGTALLPSDTPRLLLMEDIDRADIDLPHDLLRIIEDGGFDIPELLWPSLPGHHAPTAASVVTVDAARTATVTSGQVRCRELPVVAITCTHTDDLPSSFVDRCVTVRLRMPTAAALGRIAAEQFPDQPDDVAAVVDELSSRGCLHADGGLSGILDALHLRLTTPLADVEQQRWHRLVGGICPPRPGGAPE